APVLYWINVALLGSVTLFGRSINGAKRWLVIGNFTIQPSDFTKVLVVLTLATFFAANLEKIKEWGTFWRSLLHIVPFIALAVMQPH
ncbi:FtsW/RodA/SpoVE family cell cycle protein, partial [Acinetobacter baumannii]